jgi:hypothetical protein
MSDDRYDDGLVHEHGWAREALPEGITRLVAPAVHPGTAAHDIAVAGQQPDDKHDAGLVHEHHWARQG